VLTSNRYGSSPLYWGDSEIVLISEYKAKSDLCGEALHSVIDFPSFRVSLSFFSTFCSTTPRPFTAWAASFLFLSGTIRIHPAEVMLSPIVREVY